MKTRITILSRHTILLVGSGIPQLGQTSSHPVSKALQEVHGLSFFKSLFGLLSPHLGHDDTDSAHWFPQVRHGFKGILLPLIMPW